MKTYTQADIVNAIERTINNLAEQALWRIANNHSNPEEESKVFSSRTYGLQELAYQMFDGSDFDWLIDHCIDLGEEMKRSERYIMVKGFIKEVYDTCRTQIICGNNKDEWIKCYQNNMDTIDWLTGEMLPKDEYEALEIYIKSLENDLKKTEVSPDVE